MKEDFLHYIWKNGFFEQDNLLTTSHERIKIISKGVYNHNSGPDFLEAKIMIEEIVWVGNIEIHKHSSDWYAHGHEKDPAYDNVILHVVFEDDMPVYNSNNVQIPTLILSKYVSKKLLKSYNKLIKNKSILRCQNVLKQVDPYVLEHFKYKLFLERLEQKYEIIKGLLNQTQNNWRQVMFETLLKYFGGIVNKDAFEMLAKFLPYNVFIQYKDNPFQLEALLFGVSGLLTEPKTDAYYQSLQKEFAYLKEKHQLEVLPGKMIKFHRLRPLNFPTIRLAQFASLFHKNNHLFNKLMKISKPEEAYNFFEVSAGDYWKNHYNFDKVTKEKEKKLGKNFIDIILINVIVPIKFAYQKYQGIYNEDEIIKLVELIKPEKNRVITTFDKINFKVKNALDSQAILQLNANYCDNNRCLQCDIAHQILKNSIKEKHGTS